MTRIFVDADACPVKKDITKTAEKYGISVIMVYSVCHLSKDQGNFHSIVVDNESQSADLMIINQIAKNDVVVTDDYGLASIILMKKGFCLSSRGLIYTVENIDMLLYQRHLNAKILRSKGRIKKCPKRSKEDDFIFVQSLEKIIKQSLYNPYG
ncbi:MAG: YaiI/YqxD family protein [Bacillota bacterium]